jgi:hypothetical protein
VTISGSLQDFPPEDQRSGSIGYKRNPIEWVVGQFEL